MARKMFLFEDYSTLYITEQPEEGYLIESCSEFVDGRGYARDAHNVIRKQRLNQLRTDFNSMCEEIRKRFHPAREMNEP